MSKIWHSKTKLWFVIVFTAILCSSCGTLTKMRYSRGYKSNIEFNFLKKDSKKEELNAFKAVKTKRHFKDTAVVLMISNAQEMTIVSVSPNKTTNLHCKVNNQFTKKLKSSPLKAQKTAVVKLRKAPKEPLIDCGTDLFLAGMSGGFFPPLFILSGIGLLLVILGLRKLRRSRKVYRGKGKGIAVIICTILLIPLFIIETSIAVGICLLIFSLWVAIESFLISLQNEGWKGWIIKKLS